MLVSDALKGPAFLRLWAIGAFGSTGRWLDTLLYALLVVEAGGGAFAITALMLARTLPLAMFGWVAGRIAEHLAPRTALAVGAGVSTLVSLSVAALVVTDSISTPALLVAAFAGGLVWATDLPVRRTLIGEVVGAEHTASAMSLDTLAGSATRAIGPVLGGVLFASIGALGALFVSACLHFAAMLVALRVHEGGHSRLPVSVQAMNALTTDAPAMPPVRPPLQVLFGSVLMPVFVVTILFNLFAYPLLSLVPLLGGTVYALSPWQVGLLVSVEGVASTLAALLLVLTLPHAAARRVFTGAIVLYLAGGFALAFARTAVPAALALAAMGFALAAFASTQSALVLANAPPGQARRMMGVLSICIGAGPLGYFGLGALAEVVGAGPACAISAAIALIGLAIAGLRWPALLAVQPTPAA